ncbi:hypothetical protein Ahy_B01g052105 [Arachis hypogaea]|uniref:Ubiquitin-like protease family profile domain-containing protein n=1 Tax=Arachis hypogaea TaxID=3818 RepID=A0A445ANR9_ARAHY|nr:hypothetical protein Ahy_B01g052105 [Arachis hypogaea]
MKRVENKRNGKKQSVDGCVFVLMLIYFHETKFPRPFAPDAPPAPWVAHWTRKMIIDRISSEATQPLTQGSSTPSVNAASNIRKLCLNVTRGTPNSNLQIVEFQEPTRSQALEVPPLALSFPSSVQEELMKDDFIYVPPQEETQQTSNNDCPQEAEKQGVTVSFSSSVIEDLFKDDYVYEVSNEEYPCKRTTATSPRTTGAIRIRTRSTSDLWNSNNSPAKNQQHSNPNKKHLCPPEPNKQGVMGSITSSVIEQFFKDADVYQVSDEEQSQEPSVARQLEKETLILSSFDRKREDERPSFSLGISPPASQPSQPSQESDSQLEILAEAVVDAEVIAALKFIEGTSSEPSLPAAQGLYKGLREYFMSLMPGEQVHAVNFMLGTHGVKYIDKRTNKAHRFDIQQYAHHRQFLDKRKLASHPFIFVPICNGEHWWLWLVDVNKKKFYVLDHINKKPEDIPDLRKELMNKFVQNRNKTMVTKAIATVFKNMSQEKKDIVEEMGFGALAHVLEMNVSHALLRELIDYYDEYHGCLKTLHGKIYITPAKVAAALGISHDGNRFPKKVDYHKLNEEDKAIFDSLKCVTLGKKQSVEGCVFVLMLIYFHETKFPCLDGLDAPPAPWVAYWTKKMMLDRISEEATDTMMLLRYSAN